MEKVIVRKCEEYNKDAIKGIVREGMEELGYRPKGKVMIKPNIVYAHKRYAQHAYSHPSIIEAVVEELKAENGVTKVTIGERCAVTIPTRFVFKEAGYLDLAKRQGIECVAFDEEVKFPVKLSKATIHPVVHLAKTLVEADSKVYVPKLKLHASTLITCTIKLNIGILDQTERLHKHDWRLEEKIADLLEAGNPDFICVDGITVGQGGELVPIPRHMGALIMGTNACAVDAVCAHLMHYKPTDIRHLVIAHERGFGPIDFKDIEIAGDADLDELRTRTADMTDKFRDLTELDSPIRFHMGHAPGEEGRCEGGCHNMLKTAFAIQEAYKPGSIKTANPAQIVSGIYEGDLDGGNGPIIFVGTCTRVEGYLGGKAMRVKGCPVIVPFFMFRMATMLGMKSPYLDPSAMVQLPIAAIQSYGRLALNHLRK